LARKLAMAMNPRAIQVVAGAGHMGPFTHASELSRLIGQRIADTELDAQRRGEQHPWSRGKTVAALTQPGGAAA